jgi:hypothetical protein
VRVGLGALNERRRKIAALHSICGVVVALVPAPKPAVARTRGRNLPVASTVGPDNAQVQSGKDCHVDTLGVPQNGRAFVE